jgi:4-hydroxybenzoate polyprenyltransferase
MATSSDMVRPFGQLRAFAGDIKLSHTVFALPFAVLATFMGVQASGGGWPRWPVVGLVLCCMVLARTYAMGMNRLLDADLDARNPRTVGRAIPAGRNSRRWVLGAIIVCAVLFQGVCLGFGFVAHNWLPAVLATPVLMLLGAYPLFKRFSRWCHFYLGFCLALAPTCAWIAVAGPISVEPLLLSAAVLCWTAGFDILYATADVDSDRSTGVRSVPASLGISRSLLISRACHLASVGLLVAVGVVSPPLASLWFAAVGIVALVLIVEHLLVRPDDLSKLNLAFFTLNGVVSLTLGTLGTLDVLVG